ncbi:hypothetical protein Arnit_3018 [Arcobacter nitrofigilis DSM 7299]|uniref:Uncharacterized protein n=1 Tax=Arcobacter nitrofigilis (strain ATCC 33309 / DSM 7299 / CCUG 15893 / LMG 7604 / NCTC 12251 / CI) TaxID=572480 RepID=D5V7P6_ARCNC|nr:hypothetical protein [Arcobacter nitrofigilis]ADG94666.1 hypothetical protein Arnit_3018 [Arcobacter nitrofigilis DSM 7299]
MQIKELPEPTPLDEETIKAIRAAREKVEQERKEYVPTSDQLKENPWLKNAATGLQKVSDIIKDYENGVDGSGKFTLSKLTNSSSDILNDKNETIGTYGIFTKVEETTTHLAWDDENYTRSGTKETNSMSFNYTYNSYESNRFESANIKFDVKNADKEIDFNKLYDKLKSDKEFEKDFISSLDDYINSNDGRKLINYLKQALEIENATLNIKEPSDLATYGNKGNLNSMENNSSHLSLLA